MNTTITRSILTGFLASFGASAIGCLPGDTRPVPERIDLTVEPEANVRAGLLTDDGWQITYERLLMAIGSAGFKSDDSCNDYAEARYDRLFDFTVSGRERLSTIYGLGSCRVDFRLRAPSFDAILEPGTTAADVAFMRERASDRFEDDRPISALIIGASARGGVKKSFRWAFRTSYRFTDCEAFGGGYLTSVELAEGASRQIALEARPRELFRAQADDEAKLLFQPIADADANGDGDVTLDELSKAPAPSEGLGGVGPDGGVIDAGGIGQGGAWPEGGAEPPSLEALIYGSLTPRLVRVMGGGPCIAENGGGR